MRGNPGPDRVGRGAWFAVLAMLFLAAGVAWPEPVDISQAVRELGDPINQVRQQARRLLADQGRDAKPALEEATRSSDPEVAQAARELLAKMLPGVTPATPPEQREWVVRCTESQDPKERRALIGKLFGQEPFPYVLVLALLDRESSMQTRRTIVSSVLWSADQLFPALPPAEGEEAYRAFVLRAVKWRVSQAIPQIVSYLFHRSRVEEMRLQLEREVATSGDAFQRRLLVELDLLAGKDREAVSLATGLADQFAREREAWEKKREEDEESILAKELREGFGLHSTLVRAGAWQELAEWEIQSMGELTGPRLIRLGGALRLAGEDRLAAHVFALAVQSAGGLVGASSAAVVPGQGEVVDDRFWLERQVSPLPSWALLPPRELPEPMRNWTVPRPGAPLAEWNGQGTLPLSVAKCFLRVGLVGDAVASSLRVGDQELAAQILSAQQRLVEADHCYRLAVPATAPPERWLVTSEHAVVLWELGDPEAEKTVQDVVEHLRKGEVDDVWDLYSILLGMQCHGLGSALAEAGPEIIGHLPDDADLRVELSVLLLCPAYQGLAEPWWVRLAHIRPDESAEARVRQIRQLLGGEWQAGQVDVFMRQALPPEPTAKERAKALVLDAGTWAWLHQDEEASRSLQAAIRLVEEEDGDKEVANYRRTYARFLAGRDRWQEAAEQYGQASRGLVDLHVAEWATALHFAGDETGCARVMDHLGAIAPYRWAGLSGYILRLAGQQEAACRFLPFDAWRQDSPPAWCRASARDVVKDYALERRLTERTWVESLTAADEQGTGGALASHAALFFSGWRARIAVGASPEERTRVLGLARRACEVVPRLEDEVVSLARVYREAGAAAQADELVEFLLDRDEEVLDKLPNALQRLREYAWVCVRTGRRLSEGEQRVRRALEKVPRDEELIHCLAWIRHERGDLDDAIVWAQRHLELCGSDEAYYQLARWRAEKRAAAK